MEIERATIKKATAAIFTFVAARDWTQFHSMTRCGRSLSVNPTNRNSRGQL
jgi:hypothetical protein